MIMKRFLIVGSGGRESAFAIKLMEDCILFAVISHKNPTIIDCIEQSGGKYLVGDVSNPQLVTKFAIENNIDYVFVSADDPLANGVIDELLKNNLKAIGGTKEATRIEWDKIYSINLMQDICPEFTPFFKVVSNPEELASCIEEFKNKKIEVVVKPQGLTGGKGVKVMPEHLKTYQDCVEYAMQLFNNRPNEKVLLVEKLNGIEFTIMGLTDGNNLVLSPASYDYPFRSENDLGAGTGGMGCFTHFEKKLPFMTDKDLSDCQHIMQKVIDKMRDDGLFFNGVLNGGFFKTSKGIMFMEFNSRFGDPEGLNVLTILESSFSQLLQDIWHKNLSENSVKFIKKASVIKYLVAKEYPEASHEEISFTLDTEQIKSMGINLFFAAAESTGQNQYKTLKKSRVLAFGAVANEIETASALVNQAIDNHFQGKLEYRRDIGQNLDKLKI
jgi:phosphoribosylamine--glycine ligase